MQPETWRRIDRAREERVYFQRDDPSEGSGAGHACPRMEIKDKISETEIFELRKGERLGSRFGN